MKKFPIMILATATAALSAADRAALPTYELALTPSLQEIGRIQPRDASKAPAQNWTLGCEVLDRDYADWDQYKEFVAPLGIRGSTTSSTTPARAV